MKEIREESVLHFCNFCGREYWVDMIITDPEIPGPRRVYLADDLGYCKCGKLGSISQTYE